MNVRLDLTDAQFRKILISCSKNPTIEDMSQLNEVMYEVIMAKLHRMVAHDLYTTYKTAETEKERETARQKYLDERDIPASFRW